MAHACTEGQLIEQPAIGLFAELGGKTPSAMEVFEPNSALGRETPTSNDGLGLIEWLTTICYKSFI